MSAREPLRWIVALDPGAKHCGVAEWARRGEEGPTRAYTVPTAEFLDLFRRMLRLRSGRAGLVVIEEWRLFAGQTLASQVGGQMTTSEVIGAVKWECACEHVPWAEQQPSVKKTARAQMRARGYRHTPGVDVHAKDAELHLYYRLFREGILTKRGDEEEGKEAC